MASPLASTSRWCEPVSAMLKCRAAQGAKSILLEFESLRATSAGVGARAVRAGMLDLEEVGGRRRALLLQSAGTMLVG